MVRIIFIFVIAVEIVQPISSQNTSWLSYYPLSVGNAWKYLHSSSLGPFYRYKTRIKDSVWVNAHLYYELVDSRYTLSSYLRVDTSNGNLLKYNKSGCAWLNNETLVDSLAARLSDTCNSLCWFKVARCNDTSIYNIFNVSAFVKGFGYPGSPSWTIKYASGFGYFYFFSMITIHIPEAIQETLEGCVINGVVYGDTSMPLGINQINSVIPGDYSLSQNFPNPFNPLTKIRFDIPKSSFAMLIVYDLLGREVATLVDEELKPGSYEAEWDASTYSSGVYLYKLITDEFVETRKMILLR